MAAHVPSCLVLRAAQHSIQILRAMPAWRVHVRIHPCMRGLRPKAFTGSASWLQAARMGRHDLTRPACCCIGLSVPPLPRPTLPCDPRRYLGAPPEIAGRINQYFDYLTTYSHPGPDGMALISQLPSSMFQDIAIWMYKDLVTKVRMAARRATTRAARHHPRACGHACGASQNILLGTKRKHTLPPLWVCVRILQTRGSALCHALEWHVAGSRTCKPSRHP